MCRPNTAEHIRRSKGMAHLVAAAPHELPDVAHLVQPERLEQVRIGAREDALLYEVDRLIGGHHHDGDGVTERPDLAQQLKAVRALHHHV